jgi:hypothetical protein
VIDSPTEETLMFMHETSAIHHRDQRRKFQRSNAKETANKLKQHYGIPKALIQHARRHGQTVQDMVQTMAQHQAARRG